MKKKFKYSNEYSIGMYLSKYHILQQDDLDEFTNSRNTFTEDTPCNIYFILKRPRISLENTYLTETNSSLELKFYIHKKDNKLIRFIKIPKPLQPSSFRLESEYPYNYYKIRNSNGGGFKGKISV